MKLINNKFKDDEFPFTKITHTRNIARAFVLNEFNEVALLEIDRDDAFFKCQYFETPGGGMEDNESKEEAIIREIDEELGYKVEIITYLGVVEDYYNLIFRKNINHYFLCKIVSKTKIHHESKGDDLIKGIHWMKIDKVVESYNKMKDYGLEKLVKQRELPVLLLVKEYLEEVK